ncbi:MAG: FG-GAP-like repeat-containing protein [Candidatus Krumholzibacteriia bacterium]
MHSPNAVTSVFGRPFAGHRSRRGLLFGLAGALLLLAAAPAAAQVALDFPGQVPVRIAGENTDIVGYDHDGDGNQELLVGFADGSIALIRFRAGGNFELLERFAPGGTVVALTLLALAADDTVLVAAARDPDEVIVLRVQGGASPFTVLDRVHLPEDPGGIIAGHIGAPAIPGLAVTLPGIDRMVVLRFEDAEWRLAQDLDTGDRPVSVALVDLDQDGTVEIVTADAGPLSGAFSVFRWQDGAYALTDQPRPGAAPVSVLAYDHDDDGVDELFATYADAPYISIFEPVAGVLEEVDRVTTPLPTDGLLVAPVTADALAMLCWNADRGVVHYYRKIIADWQLVDTFYTGGRATAASLLDMNVDGYIDLAVANGASETVGMLFGNNLPSFRGYRARLLDGSPAAGVVVDAGGDPHLDLAVVDVQGSSLSVMAGDGGGRFSPDPAPLSLETPITALVTLRADGDDLLDLAGVQPTSDRVRIFLRRPEGGFVDAGSFVTGDNPAALEAGDLDGDGFVDLVVGNAGSGDLTLAFGAGDGTFPTVLTLPVSGNVRDIALLDLDGDALPDIAVSNGSVGIATLSNLGGRLFGQARFYTLGGATATVEAGDLDGDGDLDLVVANTANRALSFLENLGDGWMAVRQTEHPLDGRPGPLLVADVNLDGLADVVVPLPDVAAVGLVVNAGAWVFTPPVRFQPALRPGKPLFGDFNEDGIPDLLILDYELDLAVSMLNVEPNPVPADPEALVAACRGSSLEVQIQIGIGERWRLEAAGRHGWIPLGDQDHRDLGVWERAADGWRLLLSATDLRQLDEARGLRLDAGAVSFRLVTGVAPAVVRAELAAPVCDGPHAGPPGLAVVLGAPHPNPFNPAVEIAFTVRQAGAAVAAVWDLRGRRVATLLARELAAGEHRLTWRGEGDDGPVAAGAYVVTVETDGGRASRKIMLVR